MNTDRILQRQWAGYSPAHRNRTNLCLHLIAVPLFMGGTLLALYGVAMWSARSLIVATFVFLVSLFLQRRGHQGELVQPEPFTSAWDFTSRIFAEQWITFPRFVVTGGWLKNMSQAGPDEHESEAVNIHPMSVTPVRSNKGRTMP